MHKVGDKVMIDGEECTVAHVTPSIDETCEHEWVYSNDDIAGEPQYCSKCNLSFMRYIHCCCP